MLEQGWILPTKNSWNSENSQISKIYFILSLKLRSCKKFWTFLKTSGQPIAPKNVSEKFSDDSREIGRLKTFGFFQKIFQNSDYLLVGLSPGILQQANHLWAQFQLIFVLKILHLFSPGIFFKVALCWCQVLPPPKSGL